MASYYVEELSHVPGERRLGTCFNCHGPLDRTYYQVTKQAPTRRFRYCVPCWDQGLVATG